MEEARDAVKAIEGRLCKAKDKKKGKKLREGREEKRKKKDKGRRRHSPTSSGEKDKVKKKEKHRTGSARDKKREKDGDEPPRKGKKKRRSSSRRSTSSDSDGDALFGGKGREDVGGDRDRGPCGGGEVVKFRDTTDSESESFRDAPTDRKATTQLQLVRYAMNKPGPLASRMLLKMQQEGCPKGPWGQIPPKWA